MEARINHTKLPPEPVKAMFALGHYLDKTGQMPAPIAAPAVPVAV